jgi:hypothetical protein
MDSTRIIMHSDVDAAVSGLKSDMARISVHFTLRIDRDTSRYTGEGESLGLSESA